MTTLIKATQTYCEGNEHPGLTWHESETFAANVSLGELFTWANRYPRATGCPLVLEPVTSCN